MNKRPQLSKIYLNVYKLTTALEPKKLKTKTNAAKYLTEMNKCTKNFVVQVLTHQTIIKSTFSNKHGVKSNTSEYEN